MELKKVNLKLYDVMYTSGKLLRRCMFHLSVFQIMNILMNIGIMYVLGTLQSLGGEVMSVANIIVIVLFNVTYYAGTWTYFSYGIERDKFQLDDLAGGFKQLKSIFLYTLIMMLLFAPLLIIAYYTIPTEVFQDPAFFNSEDNVKQFAENHGNKIFFLFLLAVIINIVTFYALPFVMLFKMNAIEAVKNSVKMALKNILKLFSILFIIIFASFIVVSVLTGFVGRNQVLMYIIQVVYFVFLQSVFYSVYYHSILKLKEGEE